MTSNNNDLIKGAAFDIISITTMWGLVISSHLSFDNFYLFNEKYRNLAISFQGITKLAAFGSSLFVISKYFRS